MSPVLSLPTRRFLLPCAALTIAIGSLTTLPLHASEPSTATAALPSEVHQIVLDLKAIAAGVAVTDDEKQTLADDLAALATGLVKPSSSSVDQLADDLAEAAASGQLTHRAERILARDLKSILDCTLLNPGDLHSLVGEAETILATYGVNAASVQQITADLQAILDDFQTDSVATQQSVKLQAENVPTYLGMNYAGEARLAAVSADGQAAQSVLTVAAYGLPPTNPYIVAVTRHSDGGTLVLGKLTVHSALPSTLSRDLPASLFPFPITEIFSYGLAVFGGPLGAALPEGFDPADVDTLTLTDANGTERLAGSFVDAGDLQTSSRLVNLHLDAGAADANATGTVSFRVKTTATKTRDAFLLYASGLPASATVTLVADGVAAGQFTTTGQGRLVIAEGNVPTPTKASGRMLPVNALPASVDLNTLGSLTLLDASGGVLASGGL